MKGSVALNSFVAANPSNIQKARIRAGKRIVHPRGPLSGRRFPYVYFIQLRAPTLRQDQNAEDKNILDFLKTVNSYGNMYS